MKALAAGAALVFATLGWPADPCPPECKPKSPTCEQRIARAKAAGCAMPVETKIVDHRVEIPGNCSEIPKSSCPPSVTVPGPEKTVIQRVEVPGPERTVLVEVPAQESGHWLVGGGPLYNAAWGVQAVAGYQWANGWQFLAGPTWTAHEGYSGNATNCRGNAINGGGCPCVTLPYHIPEPAHLGGTALLLYRFR